MPLKKRGRSSSTSNCLLACLPPCLLAYLPACLLACVPACLLACVLACLFYCYTWYMIVLNRTHLRLPPPDLTSQQAEAYRANAGSAAWPAMGRQGVSIPAPRSRKFPPRDKVWDVDSHGKSCRCFSPRGQPESSRRFSQRGQPDKASVGMPPCSLARAPVREAVCVRVSEG